MRYNFGKIIVIALGGSIIHPRKIDVLFLRRFESLIIKWVRLGRQFVIVTGGGSVARDYQQAAAQVVSLSNQDQDWIGIHATRLNAHLLRTIFYREADPVVIDKRFKIKKLDYPITIGSGWRPGWSTDYVALQLASDFKATEAVIAGKPDYVYAQDPSQDKLARPILELAWPDYRQLIPSRWMPGAHAPVDPVAARLAAREKLVAIVIDGTDLSNFDRLLAGEEFKGSIIK